MKICLISEEFPPETGWGGIGTHTYNLSRALSDIGHEVHVVTASIDGQEQISNNGFGTIYRLPELNRQSLIISAFSRMTNKLEKYGLAEGANSYPLRSLRRGVSISKWIEDHRDIDIIEAPDYGAETFLMQFNRLSKIPVVIKLHTPLFLNQRLNGVPKNNGAIRMRKWMEKYSITHATKLISPTRSLADIISEEFRLRSIDVIRNCIDTDFFTCKDTYSNNTPRNVLYAGRLERRKGVEVLARAIPLIVRSFPSIKFMFVGRDTPTADGGKSMQEWLVNYFRQEQVDSFVEFPGEKPRAELVTFYQAADICVLPSLWENLPYTCLESMSCGTPVIASNVGGYTEIISEGVDGFLFEARNHERLAHKVITTLNNPDLRRIGIVARKRIENAFSHQAVAEQTNELYEKVLAGVR